MRQRRERWPLIMEFAVLEMSLSKCKLWYGFPGGCTDSENMFQTNGTKRMISHEYNPWHLLSHIQPHLSLTLLLKELLCYCARPMSLSEEIGPFFTEPTAMQAALNRSLYGNDIVYIPNRNPF